MKTLQMIFAIFSFILISCNQKDKEYYFPELGMQLSVPSEYNIKDKFPRRTYLDSSGSPIIDSTEIKKMEFDLMKGLLLINYPDEQNTLSINYLNETPKTGNATQYFDFSKSMQIMGRIQTNDYDTITTVYLIDNIPMQKFLMTSKTNPSQNSGFYLGKVRTVLFFAKVDYIDLEIGKEFEKILQTASFK